VRLFVKFVYYGQKCGRINLVFITEDSYFLLDGSACRESETFSFTSIETCVHRIEKNYLRLLLSSTLTLRR